MAKDHGRVKLMRAEDELVANPEQVLGLLIFKREAGAHAGMDEEVGRPLIVVRQAAEKFEMGRGERRTGLRRVGALETIARDRLHPAIEQERFTIMTGETEIAQQHVFV